ncbi:MAG: SxtJ family membrane protein [Bacteroidota bacterium]
MTEPRPASRRQRPPRQGPSPLAQIAAEVRALDLSVRSLRSFGLVVGGVFAGIALISAWRNGWTLTPLAMGFGGLGGTLMVLGALVPRILKPVYRAWMALAFALGYVMTRVILTLVFVFTVVPIGLIMRAIGKDPLAKAQDPEAESYWIHRDDPAPSTRQRLERYF